MIRVFFSLVLLAAALPSQIPEGFESAMTEFGAALKRGELAKAETLLVKWLPSPDREPRPANGEKQLFSIYGLSWGMLWQRHMERADFANAARVMEERVAASDNVFGSNHPGHSGFLTLLGSSRLRQGKYDEAIAAFGRSLELRRVHKLMTAIIVQDELCGMAEALLVKGRAKEALDLLMSVEVRPGDMEIKILDARTVVLRDLGLNERAATIEREIDGSVLKGVAMGRDVLRARVLAGRGDVAGARSILQKWIRHWETLGETSLFALVPTEELWMLAERHGPAEEAARLRQRAVEWRRRNEEERNAPPPRKSGPPRLQP